MRAGTEGAVGLRHRPRSFRPAAQLAGRSVCRGERAKVGFANARGNHRHAFSDTSAVFNAVATSKFVAGPAGWSRAVTSLTDA